MYGLPSMKEILKARFPLSVATRIPVERPGFYRINTLKIVDSNEMIPLFGGIHGITRSTCSIDRREVYCCNELDVDLGPDLVFVHYYFAAVSLNPV
ncbi:unnamed protein product [Cochlearia groenlandica]